MRAHDRPEHFDIPVEPGNQFIEIKIFNQMFLSGAGRGRLLALLVDRGQGVIPVPKSPFGRRAR